MNKQVDDERDYRNALETCESCLQLFAASLENNLKSPSPGFVDKVMAGLPPTSNSQINKRPRHWPWLHYAAAACITLALVHLGYFDYIYLIPEELQLLEHSAGAGDHVLSMIDTFKSLIDFIIVKGV
ncbi:MAG: hypothetical protein Q7J85_04090 [Bacillota bacterium]|nr:hypothetical protein [Bacillota bacterium]